VVNSVKRAANSSSQTKFVEINQQRCEKKANIALDKISPLFFYGDSLQTLHRMPSDQWGYRPVIPTAFFLTLNWKYINLQEAFQFLKHFYSLLVLLYLKIHQSEPYNRQNNVPLNHAQLNDIAYDNLSCRPASRPILNLETMCAWGFFFIIKNQYHKRQLASKLLK